MALRQLRVALGGDDEEVIQHAIEEGIIDFLLAALQVRKYFVCFFVELWAHTTPSSDTVLAAFAIKLACVDGEHLPRRTAGHVR